MTDIKLARTVFFMHVGFLVFGIVSFKLSTHESAVLDFALKYLSLPSIIFSIITTTFLFKKTRHTDNTENKVRHGLFENLKSGFGLVVIGVLISFSYFLSLKSFIELTNRHIGQQKEFNIIGRIIQKRFIDGRKGKTFYLKVRDITDKVIELRVTEKIFESHNERDAFTKNGIIGSMGFIYTE
jgi:uncharacterized protein YacL